MKTHTHTHTVSMLRHALVRNINRTLPALALAVVTLAAPISARANQTPELPIGCETLAVEAGNRLSSRVYALGVQIYRWSGTNWAFIAPEATLYSDPCYEDQVGIHYAGPTWEANDGSTVKATRVDGCTPYRGAIPWLLLKASSNSGSGVFGRVTFIQRLNTIGGAAPAEPGAFIGDEARVPYTTEYYFYRGSN